MPQRAFIPSDPHLIPFEYPCGTELGADTRMAALGKWQWRCVATRQLRVIGLTPRQIRRRREAGRLHPRYRGVDVLGTPDLSVHGEWMAAVLSSPMGVVIGARSAAELRGFLRPAPLIHLIAPHSATGAPGLCIHRAKLTPAELEICGRIPTTSIPRLFVDLAALESEKTVTRAFQEADRRGLIVMRDLYEACAPGHGRRGVRHLRGLVEAAVAPEPTRSEFEDEFSEFCAEYGLPAPKMNDYRGGEEVDASWVGTPLIIELDGWDFHSGRQSFESDRAKIERLQVAGYTVIPVTYRRMKRDPGGLAASIRTLLDRFHANPSHFGAAEVPKWDEKPGVGARGDPR